MALTGWGPLLTTWTPVATAHAVHPEQVDRCLAACGAALVVVDLNRPWSGRDTADSYACWSCIERVPPTRRTAGCTLVTRRPSRVF
jgi:hypothetical protein